MHYFLLLLNFIKVSDKIVRIWAATGRIWIRFLGYTYLRRNLFKNFETQKKLSPEDEFFATERAAK